MQKNPKTMQNNTIYCLEISTNVLQYKNMHANNEHKIQNLDYFWVLGDKIGEGYARDIKCVIIRIS